MIYLTGVVDDVCVDADTCIVSSTDLKEGKTAYIEVDNVPGLTDGDTVVKDGDQVEVGAVIVVDECNNW